MDRDEIDMEEIDNFIRENIDTEKKRLADYQALNQISISQDIGFPYDLADINIFETYKELHLIYEANKDRMVVDQKKPNVFKKKRRELSHDPHAPAALASRNSQESPPATIQNQPEVSGGAINIYSF